MKIMNKEVKVQTEIIYNVWESIDDMPKAVGLTVESYIQHKIQQSFKALELKCKEDARDPKSIFLSSVEFGYNEDIGHNYFQLNFSTIKCNNQ